MMMYIILYNASSKKKVCSCTIYLELIRKDPSSFKIIYI